MNISSTTYQPSNTTKANTVWIVHAMEFTPWSNAKIKLNLFFAFRSYQSFARGGQTPRETYRTRTVNVPASKTHNIFLGQVFMS